MAAEYFPTFRKDHIEAQAPDFSKSFRLDLDRARKIAEDNLNQDLPENEMTKDHFLYEIRNSSEDKIGHLWLTNREFFGKRSLFISDIFIYPKYRGHGLGKQTLNWVANEAKRLGFSEVSLHVFGSNAGARRLYEALGFQATSIHMAKQV